MPTDKYRAPALEKGLAIIEYLALQSSAQSQSEIALGLARSPNEIYRMLVSLESRGYIHRDPISSKYSLTLKLYYLSHRHSFVEKLRSSALQPMRQTSATIEQPCHLSVIFNGQLLVVAYSKSPKPIAVKIEEGNLYHILTTASGKILLSTMEDDLRKELLAQDPLYHKFSEAQKLKLEQELITIKEQGYIHMPSSYAQGIVDFSVPIGFTSSGITASLTVSKLLTLEGDNELSHDQIIQALLLCKREIESNLGLELLP